MTLAVNTRLTFLICLLLALLRLTVMGMVLVAGEENSHDNQLFPLSPKRLLRGLVVAHRQQRESLLPALLPITLWSRYFGTTITTNEQLSSVRMPVAIPHSGRLRSHCTI